MSLQERYLRAQSLALLEDICHWHMCYQLRKLEQELKEHKYRPDQPRVPAGNPNGGQWTSGGGGSGDADGGSSFVADKPVPDTNPIIYVPGHDSSPASDLLHPILGELLRGIPGLRDAPSNLPTLPMRNLAPSGGGNGIDDPPIEPVYPIETLLATLLPLGRVLNALRGLLGGAEDAEWTLGSHKSQTKWNNQKISRGWTDEQITDTIRYGEKYRAPNDLYPSNGATRYEYRGNYVVRDNKTNEILQIGKPNFNRPPIPPQ